MMFALFVIRKKNIVGERERGTRQLISIVAAKKCYGKGGSIVSVKVKLRVLSTQETPELLVLWYRDCIVRSF